MGMADDAWFEAQYDNRGAVPEHATIYAERAERSRRARLRRRCFLDVPYGDGPLQRLDVFPSSGPSRAVASFIHGGYWRSRDKSDFSFLADPLCAAGFTLVVPNYALCPASSVEQAVRDMLAAHAWIHARIGSYGGDGSRLLVAGHSAGAQLAAMMAACDWPAYAPGLPADLVKGVLAISGIYDLMPLRRTSMNADLRLDENAARVASPVSYRPARPVPVVTAVGTEESAEFQRQCRALGSCWPRCVRRSLHLSGANHFTILASLESPEGVLHQALQELAAAVPD